MKEIDQKVLDYIVSYKRKNDGLSPSMREIRLAMEISSTSQVWLSLQRLEEGGQISRIQGKTNGIKVVGGRWSMTSETKPEYRIEEGTTTD